MSQFHPKIEISCTCPRLRPMFPFGQLELLALITQMCTRLHEHCPHFNAQVNLVLCDDNLIQSLNKRWLQTPGPTNTLAFAAQTPKAQHQLFFSLETWRRECVLYAQAKNYYARRLLAHGLTHLAGFDHSPAMDALCDYLQSETNETIA